MFALIGMEAFELKTKREVMIGNFAIARGLVEAGLELAAALSGNSKLRNTPRNC